ncbi:MAG: wax ester/triacylglycerol synthase family O-acyltransferase [Anaerolineae bacterium]
MPPKVDPLSNVDAAWLGMEDPTNLMMVTGVLTFDEPIDFEELKLLIERRLLKFERFRQRVVQPRLPLTAPYWETALDFDMSAHLQRVTLPDPGDQSALQALVSDLLSTPLDFSRPLWQLHLVENYGDGCAIITRLHHCIADGMALVYVLLSLTDLSPDSPKPDPEPEATGDEEDGLSGPLGALIKQASSAVNAARHVTGKIVQEGLEAILYPAKALDLALQGTDHALAASRLLLRSPDPETIFKGELGVAKRGAWSRPLPLKEIKAIKTALGGTVNDVLVTAMTGGLRRYMQKRSEAVDTLNFRAAVPVNLRKPQEMGELGNKFGIVFLSLPVGIADPLARLAEVRKRMHALKHSPEAMAAFAILNAIGLSPQELQSTMVKMFGSKTTAVMTNVPGPPIPLYMAGKQIKSIMFWVPQSGRVSLGISIISYAGNVWLGVAADVGLVPDPETIIEGFYQEYEALLAMAQRRKRAPAPATAVQDDPDRCRAVTRSGRRCRNRSLDGSDYCRVHQRAGA